MRNDSSSRIRVLPWHPGLPPLPQISHFIEGFAARFLKIGALLVYLSGLQVRLIPPETSKASPSIYFWIPASHHLKNFTLGSFLALYGYAFLPIIFEESACNFTFSFSSCSHLATPQLVEVTSSFHIVQSCGHFAVLIWASQ